MTVNYISLEELNHIFNVRTWLLIKYQTTHVVPYAYKTIMYNLGIEKEKPTLEVMYYWAETRQSDDSKGEESDQDTSTRQPVSPKLSPQVRHDTTLSHQHQYRLQQRGDAITRIASPSGVRSPSPSWTQSFRGPVLQADPDSFHRQDNEINSNHGSQQTRVEQQQRQQSPSSLEDPHRKPPRQRRPVATSKTVRAIDENGENTSASRPRTNATLPSLQLHEIDELDLMPFPIARHDGGAGSDISRQIRRKPVPVREDEMKQQV